MGTSEKKTLPRREFLKAAGITGAAGVAAATLSGTQAKAAVSKTSGGTGYQETEHVQTYYDLARF
ncbi:MAG: twin-arginine translocation signal domain-containing protein [Rhodospirillales bacterium]|nr:twin-arginine translocation signal domain-containing protein [Rhodospirillales bacterium]